jgi:1-acyl-sn-glycerol-3-phosphate acyltransferase
VIEFLPRIPAGMELTAFTAKLQDVIETRSNELMREAGFTAIDE